MGDINQIELIGRTNVPVTEMLSHLEDLGGQFASRCQDQHQGAHLKQMVIVMIQSDRHTAYGIDNLLLIYYCDHQIDFLLMKQQTTVFYEAF